MKYFLLLLVSVISSMITLGQKAVPVKPRVLVSTDIGGTDPDDNQSMIHLLMYSELFNIEGLVSSPSYGDGNQGEIFRTIDLYKKDLPKLMKHKKGFLSPDYLKSITKQGKKGAAPFKGYSEATEGSEWIIKCAKKKSVQPLWILAWGGLEDVAQALHDAPEIQKNIKVYWIGGPNKKWSPNSYAYIVANFPKLWFIEANSSYNGFFSNNGVPDSLNNKNYYNNFIKEAGALGKDFKANRYKGNVKMGDTPSLLYMMDGDPNVPTRDNWGGSFEKFSFSPRVVYNRNTTVSDTVPVYSIVELHFKGPRLNIPQDSACFTLAVKAGIGEQKWDGFYLGNGEYVIRYIPKQTETISYAISSKLPGFVGQNGAFVVDNTWPGKPRSSNYVLGANWYTDKKDPKLFDGIWQGGKTVLKWRNTVLLDWAQRWKWLE